VCVYVYLSNNNVAEDEIANNEDQNSINSNPTVENNEDSSAQTEHEEEQSDNEVEAPVTTRSGRVTKAPIKMNLHQCHLHTQGHAQDKYSTENAQVIAKIINNINDIMVNTNHKHHSFVETFSLKKGLQKFGQKGHDAASGEMMQLHDRQVFKPIDISTLTQQEKKRAMDSLIFLTEKRDGRVKAQTCANGSTQRIYTNKEEAASPTAMTESILLTSTINAKEKRDIMTVDIPNAFVQTDIETNNGERIIMKIKGQLVDMLVTLDPETYADYVTQEGNGQVLYVQVLKALYGMLQLSLLFYKKTQKGSGKHWIHC
jgi:hypothetical protein